MLTMKRVSTVLSNYQENPSAEDLESKSNGCGLHCLGKCCLSVAKFPLYAYDQVNGRVREDVYGPCHGGYHQMSCLSNVLLGQWEDRMNKGLLGYDVTSCETKVIPGKCGFIAQLNEGRHLKKRPTEFRVDKVLQAFDHNKFNFTQMGQEEVLFRFEQSKDYKCHYEPFAPLDPEGGSPNIVAINVSPIEYGHVLLIPRITDCLPHKIDNDSLLLALNLAKEASDPFFRVGYNSLGAFATINHLHFQAYYLAITFPIEKAPTFRRMSSKGPHEMRVVVSKLLNYPVQGLVFEGECSMSDLCDAVASSCIVLQSKNIPFNILISSSGKRIFLLPQCYLERQARGEVSQEVLGTQLNPAVWEISGHMVLKYRQDYDQASDELAWRLLAEVSLSEDRFEFMMRYVLEAANLQWEEEYTGIQQGSIYNSTAPKVASLPAQDCLVRQ